jgi:membrane-bound serine protease (ClpP class)
MIMQKKIIILFLILVILSITSYAQYAQPDSKSIGEKYCGSVEKKYGLYNNMGEFQPSIIVKKFYYIEINGIIDQSTEEYVDHAISIAERENAGLIILLNTPGGYLDPATNIVARINSARIPVISYVVEKWAESAGTLILVTSHVAAMQPGTIIGSLQPVMYDPQTGSYKPVNESKIINPIIKILCEHGASKGRNATALVRFILYNDNYGAEEAYRYHVIDLVATNVQDLLNKVNGKIIVLPSGVVALVDYGGEPVEEIPPTPRIVMVHALSDPILSGILLSLGSLILIFSIISGHLAYATIGALLLLLGLAGTGYSPNMVSILLILLGAILLAVEIHTPGFGIFGGVGIVMLVLGIVILPTGGGFAVAESYADAILYTLYLLGATGGLITAFIVYKFVQIRKKKPVVWTVIGAHVKALDDIPANGEGFVQVEGEYWKARALEDISRGDRIVVVGKDGPVLIVKKYSSEPGSPGASQQS